MDLNKELISFELLNKEQEIFFKEQGYVVFDFLDKEQVNVLKNLYKEIQSTLIKEKNKIFTSGEHLTESSARQIDKAIHEVIFNSLDSHFANYDSLMAAFIVKPPKQAKEEYFEWHQDLSFVDEAHYSSAQLWIPLQDTNSKNGNLQLIPNTHLYSDVIRTSPIYPSFFKAYLNKMKAYAQNIPLKLGQAVLFNHKLLHASTPNSSSQERLAVISTLKPREAQWLYFNWNENRKVVNKYEANLDFYLKVWMNKMRDESKVVESFSYEFPEMTALQFSKWKEKQFSNASFIQKIKSFF
jgi:ectoine hydroxylase-related dioxygenase (phytanoyl-CoA dioxygenase family)